MNEIRFGRGQEDQGLAALADAGRPAHTMHILFCRHRRVVLNDPIHRLKVQSASRHVLSLKSHFTRFK